MESEAKHKVEELDFIILTVIYWMWKARAEISIEFNNRSHHIATLKLMSFQMIMVPWCYCYRDCRYQGSAWFDCLSKWFGGNYVLHSGFLRLREHHKVVAPAYWFWSSKCEEWEQLWCSSYIYSARSSRYYVGVLVFLSYSQYTKWFIKFNSTLFNCYLRSSRRCQYASWGW